MKIKRNPFIDESHIEKGTPAIAIVSQESVNLNARSNIKEVKDRGANKVIISLSSLSVERD